MCCVVQHPYGHGNLTGNLAWECRSDKSLSLSAESAILVFLMTEESQWYCVHTKPLCENRVSSALRSELNLEVFCPFIRFERARRNGRVWACEAMFPRYVFAQFGYQSQARQIRAMRGVVSIVCFGGRPALVPPEIIRGLRASVQDEEMIVIQPGIRVGEEVNVVAGPFQGLRAVVTRLLPARERVSLLLEVLGMEREVEVPESIILPDVDHPLVQEKA